MGGRNSKDNKISQEGTNTQHSTPNTSNRADISVENKNPILHCSKIISLIRQANYSVALKQLEIMEDLHSQTPDFHYWKGLAYLGLNDLQKAQESCEQAIKYDPNHILALAEIGNIYILAQKYEEAHQVFTELLKIDQKSFEAHLGLGFIRTQINDFKTAQQHYEFVLNCGLEEKITSLNYGHMLFKQKL